MNGKHGGGILSVGKPRRISDMTFLGTRNGNLNPHFSPEAEMGKLHQSDWPFHVPGSLRMVSHPIEGQKQGDASHLPVFGTRNGNLNPCLRLMVIECLSLLSANFAKLCLRHRFAGFDSQTSDKKSHVA